MKAFVTGSAGFIGSNLVDRLLADGHEVIGYDNFKTGRANHLMQAALHSNYTLVNDDILSTATLAEAMLGSDVVFHLAANADVRHGLEHPNVDLEQNTIGTFSVLEAMVNTGVNKIVFASSASVYGEPSVFPTPEDAPMPVQTSLYGASKLAAEALIQAFCEGYGLQSYIFRFVSILGKRYSHGHVFDFYKQLKEHPDHLGVLGDGYQRKSYLYVQDAIDGILLALSKATDSVNIFNLAHYSSITVRESIDVIYNQMGLSPKVNFGTGERGWLGDSPMIQPSIKKMTALGWQPKVSIYNALIKTIDYLKENEWLIDCKE